ncbi:MAG: hypothetical protein O3C57_07015, partial [Verrucomicrobia bacterium]|nr:hypothetical protein [Verrucomicrobiota bacterium]
RELELGTGQRRDIDRPVYSVSHDGHCGISLNFARLQRLRPGYGYQTLPDLSEGSLAPSDDGLWAVDMATGTSRLIVSLAQVASYEVLPGMQGAEHYFNHVLFSPSGDRFMFFHLWVNKGKRHSRLMTCDRVGKNLFPLINEAFVSHYNWVSDRQLIAYADHPPSGKHYYLHTDQTQHQEIVGSGLLLEDGHPSFSPNGEFLLTDTYPDDCLDRHLLLFHPKQNRLDELGRFYEPLNYRGEKRCDLHPRWSSSGRYVCVDSVYSGRRKMCVLDLGSASDLHATVR